LRGLDAAGTAAGIHAVAQVQERDALSVGFAGLVGGVVLADLGDTLAGGGAFALLVFAALGLGGAHTVVWLTALTAGITLKALVAFGLARLGAGTGDDTVAAVFVTVGALLTLSVAGAAEFFAEAVIEVALVAIWALVVGEATSGAARHTGVALVADEANGTFVVVLAESGLFADAVFTAITAACAVCVAAAVPSGTYTAIGVAAPIVAVIAAAIVAVVIVVAVIHVEITASHRCSQSDKSESKNPLMLLHASSESNVCPPPKFWVTCPLCIRHARAWRAAKTSRAMGGRRVSVVNSGHQRTKL